MAEKYGVEIGPFYTILACSKREFLIFWTIMSKNYGRFFAGNVKTAVKSDSQLKVANKILWRRKFALK